MIQEKGPTAFITGKSTSNQRIERFWRDVTRSSLNFYKILFCFISKEYGLDPDNVYHIYILHHLFLPCINADLQRFKSMWNNHIIRGVGKSPNQLIYENQHLAGNVPATVNPEDYEVELEGDDDQNPEDQVVLHPIKCPLDDDQERAFVEKVSHFELEDLEDLQKILINVEAAVEILVEILETNV